MKLIAVAVNSYTNSDGVADRAKQSQFAPGRSHRRENGADPRQRGGSLLAVPECGTGATESQRKYRLRQFSSGPAKGSRMAIAEILGILDRVDKMLCPACHLLCPHGVELPQTEPVIGIQEAR